MEIIGNSISYSTYDNKNKTELEYQLKQESLVLEQNYQINKNK